MTTSPRSRFGIAALALSAMGASFAAGAAWSDRDHEPSGRLVAGPERLPLGLEGALVRASSCDELLDWYVDNTVEQVGPWGWDQPHVYAVDGVAEDMGRADSLAPTSGVAPQSSSATGTNVQEAGVDEADVVKTNGRLLVRVDGDDLTTYDVSGDAVRRLSTIDLPGPRDRTAELLLIGDQAVVVSRAFVNHWAGPTDTRTVVQRVDLADPADPELAATSEYTADVLSTRSYGDTVRLVLRTGLPELDFVQPGDERSEQEALRENRRIVRESRIGDWLPTVSDDDGEPEQAVGCEGMSIPEDFSGGGSVVVVGFGADDPVDRSTMGVATSSDIVYSSTDRLYLATGTGWSGCCVLLDDVGSGRWGGTYDGTTTLHAFELTGRSAEYVASGEVEGSIRDRWSMDAAAGTLRVALGPTSETGNFNSVVTLREQDGRLEEIGRVDRLGVDEEIKSVRWFDDLAIVVTFRQVDPLYAIDLSDPVRPRKLGQLKIPGFSSYLHPIDGDRMIGIGTDASLSGMTRGGQAALFDLSDLRAPKRVDKVDYGKNREALAGHDPRQFTWLADRSTALTVIGQWGGAGGRVGWVSVLEVGEGGSLTNTLVRGTYGERDVATLRTVPLPDGRVVLASEDSARFLRW